MRIALTRVHSKLKEQNSRTFKNLKLHFSSTKSIDKETYHTCATSKFRVKYIRRRICNTQWEVLLSKQVNYNQVLVKCQILQECCFQNFYMQIFKIWNIQIQRLFKNFQGPEMFFSQEI